MDVLEDLKMSLSNFSFAMVYIIHKMLILIKNHLNYFRDNTFQFFLRSIIDLHIFLKKYFFVIFNDGKSKA